ncbi:unnamed protein product [marine sediment metagenome]|uniref:Uncharacterized protein n=1 Tax=marine sediment metagenome TaxID=412755 RepID=X1H7B6_9ZZZZ
MCSALATIDFALKMYGAKEQECPEQKTLWPTLTVKDAEPITI